MYICGSFTSLASPSKRDILPASMFRKSPSKAGPSASYGSSIRLGARASLNSEDEGVYLIGFQVEQLLIPLKSKFLMGGATRSLGMKNP